MATATTEPVRLPPGPRIPKLIQGFQFLVPNHAMFSALSAAISQRRGEGEYATQ